MAVESRIEQRDEEYFNLTSYFTSHTGVVSIKVEEGQDVEEGDTLYTITRLGLIKPRLSGITGKVRNVSGKNEGMFCGYYTHVLDVEHQLSPEEAQVLEEEKYLQFVTAPQGAQYFVTSNPGMPPFVSIGDYVEKGKVVAIAMVMKKRREIVYEGERGRVARIYFMNGQQCHAGDRLIGIVPKPIRKRSHGSETL
jgi:biotin carboxyl carrier protein